MQIDFPVRWLHFFSHFIDWAHFEGNEKEIDRLINDNLTLERMYNRSFVKYCLLTSYYRCFGRTFRAQPRKNFDLANSFNVFKRQRFWTNLKVSSKKAKRSQSVDIWWRALGCWDNLRIELVFSKQQKQKISNLQSVWRNGIVGKVEKKLERLLVQSLEKISANWISTARWKLLEFECQLDQETKIHVKSDFWLEKCLKLKPNFIFGIFNQLDVQQNHSWCFIVVTC